MNFKDLSSELEVDEIKDLEEAAAKAIVYDDDSPEMTPEMLAQYKRVMQHKRTKQTASIRLSEKSSEVLEILWKRLYFILEPPD